MLKVGIAVVTLNQFALDFEGNLKRIIQSLDECIKQNISIRIGPELEICGYSCEDAFFEEDTVFHCWHVLSKILKQNYNDILIDLGMPITKDSSLYNCRIIILNNKIVAIRPKTILANNGNYRETRWFTPWLDLINCTWFKLPPLIQEITKQKFVPFGSNIVIEVDLSNKFKHIFGNTSSIKIGFEICEELWNSFSENIKLFNNRGCDLICNSSGSYWEIRKINKILDLIKNVTFKAGGIYAFSNLIGCDGARLCFYGRSLIVSNGNLLSKTTECNTLLNEVEIAIAAVDLNEVKVYRHSNNIKVNSHLNSGVKLVFNCNKLNYNNNLENLKNLTIFLEDFELFKPNFKYVNLPLLEVDLKPQQEIYYFTSLWLWDYLRKSKFAKGFIVPLSGGLDSSSVALIIYSLCHILVKHKKNLEISNELKRIWGFTLDENEKKNNLIKKICSNILHCVYLESQFSSEESKQRANDLAQLIGAKFSSINFTHIYQDINKLGENVFEKKNFNSNTNVNILQQNLQARLRMILTYFLSEGNRLVLATGNVDEALVGYLTKYDCSAADLNPIGSLSKNDLRKFVTFLRDEFFEKKDQNTITRILNAIPSAELIDEKQNDEIEIGLTYEELSLYGSLRKGDLGCYGPYGLFCKLISEKDNSNFCINNKKIEINDTIEEIAIKVKRFFSLYAKNRHKQTVLTPALHAVSYSPDDNRFDHRQFLYDSTWKYQFKCIDDYVKKMFNE